MLTDRHGDRGKSDPGSRGISAFVDGSKGVITLEEEGGTPKDLRWAFGGIGAVEIDIIILIVDRDLKQIAIGSLATT